MNLKFILNSYTGSEKTGQKVLDFHENEELYDIYLSLCKKKTVRDGVIDNEIVFTAQRNFEYEAGIGILFENNDWSPDNYVFIPSALYNGNRFFAVEREYPPMFTDEEKQRAKTEPVITDVPRLSVTGASLMQICTGDMATPCVGYFSPEERTGHIIFFPQSNKYGNYGVTITENEDKSKAQLTISSPCVREKYKYGMCTTKEPSDDRGVKFKKDDKIAFSFREHCFSCNSITEFLNYFFDNRTDLPFKREHPNKLSWSHAYELIEEKYNKRNWLESPGFYKSSEASSSINRQWQTGWVGGAMNTLPMFVIGNEISKKRSAVTLDFVFGKLQHPSGFLYGTYCDDRAYGDDANPDENKNNVLTRKDADALYYLAKQISYLETKNEVKSEWREGLRKLADAFVNFYNKNGELGQFIDIEKQIIVAGSSASAGIAPAGLVVCSVYFKNNSYLEVARKLAEDYYRLYIAKGYTGGGPGEILSSPDSESAFGLLESFVVLYACTKDKKWLEYARNTASICASWCVSYDHKYDKDTQFYQRGVCTTGAVWANVQNKHAAPGICTLSGSSLFRLFRDTQNVKYLELCKDIAHNITQYVSTPENPMRASYIWHNNDAKRQKRAAFRCANIILKLYRKNGVLKKLTEPMYNQMFNPTGRINERANLSDWEGSNNVGEVPLGSCWCEVSTMMTCLEIPSVYIQKDTGFCYPIDHVECKIDKTEKELTALVTNPTEYKAEYRLFVEDSKDCAEPIDDLFFTNFKVVSVEPHETLKVKI